MAITKFQENKQEYLELQSKVKALVEPLSKLKKERRADLMNLLQSTSSENHKKLISTHNEENKKLTQEWKKEHAELLSQYKDLVKKIKSDRTVLDEIKKQAKEIWPKDGNKEFSKELEAFFIWESLDNSENIETNSEIPQEILDYRKKMGKNMKNLTNENKEKMLEALENIPHKIEIDNEWSITTTIKLWNKTYKILNPKLENHTDNEYYIKEFSINRLIEGEVQLWWMWWDNTDNWKNKELAKYVKEQNIRWFHIPKIEEMKTLLEDLGETVGLSKKEDQLAMLMFLTWMNWTYFLSMWTNEKSQNSGWRSILHLDEYLRDFSLYTNATKSANLCMIACS